MNTGKFEDAIMVYHKMVPDLFCERCLQYAEKICTERLATTGGDKQYRNVHGKTLTQKTVSEQIYFKKVYDEVFNFYQQYKIFFPQVAATRLTQVDFLKYTPGGKYLFHTDDGAASPRSLSIIINLNEDLSLIHI